MYTLLCSPMVSLSVVAGLQERSFNQIRQHSWIESKQEERMYFIKAAGNVGQFYSQLLQFRSKVTSYKPFKWTHQSWNVAQLDLEYLFLAPFLGWGASGNIKGGSYNFRCQCNISCRISYFEIGSGKTVHL